MGKVHQRRLVVRERVPHEHHGLALSCHVLHAGRELTYRIHRVGLDLFDEERNARAVRAGRCSVLGLREKLRQSHIERWLRRIVLLDARRDSTHRCRGKPGDMAFGRPAPIEIPHQRRDTRVDEPLGEPARRVLRQHQPPVFPRGLGEGLKEHRLAHATVTGDEEVCTAAVSEGVIEHPEHGIAADELGWHPAEPRPKRVPLHCTHHATRLPLTPHDGLANA